MELYGAGLVRSVDGVLDVHRGGKLSIRSRKPIRDRQQLAQTYTPGVGRVASLIADAPELAWQFTGRNNTIAVVSDGSAVLGLGDLGPLAALPVMEGKASLFAELAGINAVPLCLDTTNPDAIIEIVSAIAPSFGGINLEDISAPRCFEIERLLEARLDIPVFHDDQHGTAIVVLAALTNAAAVTGRCLADMRVVVAGTGAAGSAIARFLLAAGIGGHHDVESPRNSCRGHGSSS